MVAPSRSEDQECALVLYGRLADDNFAQDRDEFSAEEQAALSWVYSHERAAFDWMASKARDLVQQYCKFNATAPIPREAQKAILATMILSCETLISVKQQLQELSKQADARLQLWSERWRVDRNYFEPLSNSGATQLADALCIAVANAGQPQLVAEVAVRNEFFLKQIGELAHAHQLKRQRSMQNYRARLHAAEQALIECTRDVMANDRHREPLELSLGASASGADVSATLPQRTPVEAAAEDIGAHILTRRHADLQDIIRAQPMQSKLLDDLLNPDLLNRDPSLFLAYNHSSEVMEMYEIRTTPNDAAGLMLQVGHKHVRKGEIPRYLNSRVQKFQSVDTILEYLPDDPDAGWNLARHRRTRYQPVRYLNDGMQKELSKVWTKSSISRVAAGRHCFMESCQIATSAMVFRQPKSLLQLLDFVAGLEQMLARQLLGRCSSLQSWTMANC